jgi:aromatic-L-amino-acid/L-tryptophan decarboxylase
MPRTDPIQMRDDTDLTLSALGDLPDEILRAELHLMADWAADYRSTIGERPILIPTTPGEIASGLETADWEEPTPLNEIRRELDQIVMPGIVHWGHPAFLGYFGSTSNGPALLGEIAAAALNVSSMTWRASPAATEMEAVTLRWIQQLVGLDPAFMGIVYDTASVAVMHALAAARERCGVDARSGGLAGRSDVPVLRVYASDQAHSSVEKAAIVLGIGERNVVRVGTDDSFRLDVAQLKRAIGADLASGMRPMAVVATIGTTSTGSVDPIRAIAEVCAKYEAWLHIDAAYGGALAAIPEGRWVMDGVEAADSVVINPHKWLFVPLDFSVLYTRWPEMLRSVFSLVPEYLEGDASTGPYPDYMDYGIQLGRRFRALKAWMVFRAFGRSGIIARIREHCRLAALLASWVESDPDFQLAAPVTMGIVTFRSAPQGMSADDTNVLNEAIVDSVNSSGKVYVTRTRLRGHVAIRIGLGNVLTTQGHLEKAWQLVSSTARDLAKSSAFSLALHGVAR